MPGKIGILALVIPPGLPQRNGEVAYIGGLVEGPKEPANEFPDLVEDLSEHASQT